MIKPLSLLPAGLALGLVGCTLAPKYQQPAAPVPAEWPTGPAYAETGTVKNAQEIRTLPWPDFFPDEGLRRVIALALENNRDLQLAALNVQRARAIHGIQRAALLPTVDAVGRMSRQRTPADLSSSGRSQTTERWDANLGVASWEIDFFGRLRSLKDRALEEYLASEQAHRSAQIMLVSSVATAYLALAADRESLTLAGDTLQTQQDVLRLAQRRFDLGLVTELDLRRAQTQVETARGDMADLTRQVAQDENALNLLLGTPCSPELLPPNLAAVQPPAGVQPGLSSAVLLQRPDVLQAEHLLKAANADIGAARAAFFPRISLTTAIGTASSDLSGLFKSGAGAWSYAPQIVMPIFDARTWSAHRAAKVQQEIAVKQYEQAIQSAFREVADTLAFRGTVDERVAAQQSLVEAVTATSRLATSRYDKGIDSYLGVLDAQRSLYTARQGLVFLQFAKRANDVRLYAVLGGGGQPTEKVETLAKSQAH